MQPVKSLQLTAVYEPDEDGWIHARALEMPGANTCGRTREEARTMLQDAIRELVLSYLDDEQRASGTDVEYERLEVSLV